MKKITLLTIVFILALFGARNLGKKSEFIIEKTEENIRTTTTKTAQTQPKLKQKSIPKPQQEPQKKYPNITLSTKMLEQGDTLSVRIQDAKEPKITLDGINIPLIKTPKSYIGIYGIDARETPRKKTLRFFDKRDLIEEHVLTIQKRGFPITELILSTTQRELGETPETAAQSIIQNDNAKLYEVLDTPNVETFIQKSFQHPLPNQIDVGAFGNIRKSGDTEIRHLGVDLDGTRGDPIYAINSGKVRLAQHLSNYGNTVIIDHGTKIFSLYLHLDSIHTEENKIIEKGEVLGTIGNTGAYSLDPHLHLSIKTNGASVDPLRFIQAANQAFE